MPLLPECSIGRIGKIGTVFFSKPSSGADVQEAVWEQEYDFKDSYGLSPTLEGIC